ncbi:uncharacterized protein LOC125138310 isoform X2 [Tachysurus fulvidraco]|uniref:uncharacterized protein LOC125138310 isoform X2 n=1 Tax=Tachysurus fulvidraco TaxID=1234273 RepID=UPI001FEFADA6|nr:uncharacterized protein LOC125138310 isoform X2 [Tachysurus fulvidraco]
MMVLLCNMIFFSVWMLHGCWMSVQGELLCKRELLKSTNVSAKLQSDVLLPCNFDPVLLRSDKTADVVAVWRQINTTKHGLLEISHHGRETFWNYRDGRVKHFPKLSASGNFSILLKKVQPYELGLYTCELYHGFNCSIGYQEIQLGQGLASALHQANIITAATTGAVVLCLIIISVCYIITKRKPQPHPENHGDCSNPIYVSYHNTAQPSHGSDADLKENPIYETVWNSGGSSR